MQLNIRNVLSKGFSLLLIVVMLFPTCMFAAYTPQSNDVYISQPAGSEYLPSFDVDGDTTLQDSFLFKQIIPFLIKYALRLAVALAVAAIVWGGYLYITSFGDTEKHGNAQKTITWALIGLVLAISAYTFVRIVTSIQFTT